MDSSNIPNHTQNTREDTRDYCKEYMDGLKEIQMEIDDQSDKERKERLDKIEEDINFHRLKREMENLNNLTIMTQRYHIEYLENEVFLWKEKNRVLKTYGKYLMNPSSEVEGKERNKVIR